MRNIVIIMMLVAVASAHAQVLQQQRAMPGISSLDVEGGFSVHLLQGDDEKIIIQTSEPKVFDAIDITNRGGAVSVRSKGIEGGGNYTIDLYVYFKTIEQVKAQLVANNLDSYTELNLDRVTLDVKGAGNVKLKLNCNDISLTMNDIHSVILQGMVSNDADMNISLVKTFYAANFQVLNLNVTCENIKTGWVWANGHISISAKGYGSLTYKGNAEEGTINVLQPFSVTKQQ